MEEAYQKAKDIIDSCIHEEHLAFAEQYVNQYLIQTEDRTGYDELMIILENKKKSMLPLQP